MSDTVYSEGYDDGFKEFFEEVKKNPQYDCEKIEKAYNLAHDAHKNQRRRSGEPYIMHPVVVAKILFNLGMDNECIIGALLHDVVEDTEYNIDYIKKEFGDEVALLVDGVTKLGQIPLSTREEVQAENIRKMFIAMNEDIRVIIIKLCDRLHNMRTAKFWPEYKQREKSLETLEIYAPIAHRLGIRPIKEELEDLAIYYLDPIAYKEIEKNEVRYEEIMCDDAEYLIVAFGSCARIGQKALELAREQGIKVGLLRPITLWPFPTAPIAKYADKVKGMLSLELNAGQMIEDIKIGKNVLG